MACVGQISIHALQVPQWFCCGTSVGNGRLIKISPRKNHEPCSRDSNNVCLPRQPRWAFCASSTSITGALSVNTRHSHAHGSPYLPCQFLQTIAHHLVVIAPQRITRNKCATAICQHFMRVLDVFRVVVHAHRNDAQCTGHQLRRTRTFAAMFCHIIHRAVMAVGQPLQQISFGRTQLRYH